MKVHIVTEHKYGYTMVVRVFRHKDDADSYAMIGSLDEDNALEVETHDVIE